jgi:hypothetical protein
MIKFAHVPGYIDRIENGLFSIKFHFWSIKNFYGISTNFIIFANFANSINFDVTYEFIYKN